MTCPSCLVTHTPPPPGCACEASTPRPPDGGAAPSVSPRRSDGGRGGIKVMLVMTEVAPVCVASHEDGVGARTRRGAWEVGASQESRASHGDGEGLCTRMGSCTRGFGPGAGAFAPGRGLARGWGCSHEDGPCTRMGLCTTTGPRLSTVRGQPGFGGAGQRRSSPAPLPRVCKPRLPAVTRVVWSCRSPRCPQQTWRRRLPPLVALNKHGHRPPLPSTNMAAPPHPCPPPTWRRQLHPFRRASVF